MQSATYQFSVGHITVQPPPGTVVSGTAVEVSIQEGASLFASFEPGPASAVSEWRPYASPIIITSNVTFHLKGSKPGYQPALRAVAYQIARL